MELQLPLLAAAALAFAAIVPAQARELPQNTRLDLYLLAGQSNMAGRGKVGAEDKVADLRVWTLTKDLKWTPAVDPIHFDKPEIAGVGPGRTFGLVVSKATPGAPVGLVPCAVGGTSIDEWKKGGKLYTDALARARAAMQHGTFQAILWHQGETNIDRRDLTGYWDKLRALIADFRADLHAPTLPVIVGQLGRFRLENMGDVQAFNAELAAFAAREPHCACVTSEGLADRGDHMHFNTEAQHELGRRYAAAYLKLIGVTSAQ